LQQGLALTNAGISRCSLEGDDSISDSGTDYAQDENWHETNEMVEEVKNGDDDNDDVACDNDVQWVWCAIQMSQKNIHQLNSMGFRKMLRVF
jgi:hypothetical protein